MGGHRRSQPSSGRPAGPQRASWESQGSRRKRRPWTPVSTNTANSKSACRTPNRVPPLPFFSDSIGPADSHRRSGRKTSEGRRSTSPIERRFSWLSADKPGRMRRSREAFRTLAQRSRPLFAAWTRPPFMSSFPACNESTDSPVPVESAGTARVDGRWVCSRRTPPGDPQCSPTYAADVGFVRARFPNSFLLPSFLPTPLHAPGGHRVRSGRLPARWQPRSP